MFSFINLDNLFLPPPQINPDYRGFTVSASLHHLSVWEMAEIARRNDFFSKTLKSWIQILHEYWETNKNSHML
jgi:hypothetical protein